MLGSFSFTPSLFSCLVSLLSQLHWLISQFTSLSVISIHKNREMPQDASLKESNFLKNERITWRCTAYMYTVHQFNAESGRTKRAEIYILPVALCGNKCQKDHGRVIFLTNQSFLNISCSQEEHEALVTTLVSKILNKVILRYKYRSL